MFDLTLDTPKTVRAGEERHSHEQVFYFGFEEKKWPTLVGMGASYAYQPEWAVGGFLRPAPRVGGLAETLFRLRRGGTVRKRVRLTKAGVS